MVFWDNMGQKVSETTTKAMQKVKEMSNVAKLNSMISEEETKINNIYYQIGKLYTVMYSYNHEEEFATMIAALREADEKIRSYRQQIQDIKGVVHCLQCGAEVQVGVAFCSSCGVPMLKEQLANSDVLIKCDNCGAMVKKEVRFCTVCGNPMIQMATPKMTNISMIEGGTQSKICPNCSAKVEMGVAFCTECGTKF